MFNTEEKISPHEKAIENDFKLGLQNAERKTEDVGAPDVAPVRVDFISDDVLNFLLGHKNKYIVKILSEGLGKEALEMLNGLYVLSDNERRLYKTVIQDFIRDNFPEWEEKIARVSGGALVGLFILEAGRLHEAKILVKAQTDLQAKNKKEAA